MVRLELYQKISLNKHISKENVIFKECEYINKFRYGEKLYTSKNVCIYLMERRNNLLLHDEWFLPMSAKDRIRGSFDMLLWFLLSC